MSADRMCAVSLLALFLSHPAAAQEVMCGLDRFCASGAACRDFTAPRPFALTFQPDGTVDVESPAGRARMVPLGSSEGARSYAGYDERDSAALLTVFSDGTLELTSHSLSGRQPASTVTGRCEFGQ